MGEQEMFERFAAMLRENNEAIFQYFEKEIHGVRDEIGEVRTELKEEIQSVRQEISDVRTELKEEIQSVRTELKEEIQGVRTEMQDNVAQLRVEIKEEGERSRNEIRAYIEQTVIKRLDSLFDGYLTIRERNDALREEVDTLRIRLERVELVVKSLVSREQARDQASGE